MSAPANVWEFTTRELISRRIATFRHLRNSLAIPLEIVDEDGKRTTVSPPNTKPYRKPYLNTLVFDPESLQDTFNNAKMRKRTRLYFVLGASLGPILTISSPQDYIKALSILMNEFDTFLSEGGGSLGGSGGSGSGSSSTNIGGSGAGGGSGSGSGGGSGAPTGMGNGGSGGRFKKRGIFRKSRGHDDGGSNSQSLGIDTGDFSYLDTHIPPFDLSFLQVFDTFCQITIIMYSRLADVLSSVPITQAVFDTVGRIDQRFRKVTVTITKELEEFSKDAITRELRSLDPLERTSPESTLNVDWDAASTYN
ncbi:hypothetical protein H4219_002756 [Mycoemilia scoparia]|uniref:Uncharacterized protein n=1 Tax=Mycoemilia scoparia TaxID=417184 RepID=A0A9W7ZWS7_9FUNG|nr:hypothetical protein H4219_002756 [Mycoemilia scoparia]